MKRSILARPALITPVRLAAALLISAAAHSDEARPLLLPHVDRARIAEMARSDEHARVIAATGVHSMICVPLVARTRI